MKKHKTFLLAITAIWLTTGIIAPMAARAAASESAALALAPGTGDDIAALTAADCTAMLHANVIGTANPLPCKRLSRVRFTYLDFDGVQHDNGQFIVMDVLAPHVARLMKQLLDAKFPLHGARPLTDFGGDDAASMADNNSSAFNGRNITGGKNWSKHAYGAAIDINPLQNPYLSRAADGTLSVLPATSAPQYTERGTLRPGMAETAGVRELFAANGFLIWGGSWREPVDYQHFEIGERAFIDQLARAKPSWAAVLFDNYVADYRNCTKNHAAQSGGRELCAQKTMRGARGS